MAYPIPLGGYKRVLHELSTDLTQVARDDVAILTKYLHRVAERLTEEEAKPRTPVDTGFMQSRWMWEETAPLEVTISNDTYYLPFVNTWSHPNFAEMIAEETPRILNEELLWLGVELRRSFFSYDRADWHALKKWQLPIKTTEFGPYGFRGPRVDDYL